MRSRPRFDGFVAMGDDRGEARARSKAAIVFRRLNQIDRSIMEAEAALRYFRDHSEPAFESSASLELGQAFESRGDLDSALRVYLEALQRLGDGGPGERKEIRKMRAFIQDCAANVYSRRGQFEQARPLRKRVIPIFEELQLPHDAVTAWTNLAQDQIQLKDLDGAANSLEQATRWADKLNPFAAESASQKAKIALVSGLRLKALFKPGGPARL